MKKITLSLALTLVVVCAHCDVKSVILSADDHQPVPFACVINRAKTLAIIADAEGRFTIPSAELPKDSVIITRIGYASVSFVPTNIPDTIYLEPKTTELQGVVVNPLKKKTLGALYKPSFIQQWAIDMMEKHSPKSIHRNYFNKEIARCFKLKHDSQLIRVRVCTSNPDPQPITFILNIYRKVDDEWVSVLNDPISKTFDDTSAHYKVREFNIMEYVEAQPAGEYLIGVTFPTDPKPNCSFTAESLSFARTYHRSLMDETWERFEPTVGMELDIAY